MAYEVVVVDDVYEISTLYGEYTDHDDALDAKAKAEDEIETANEDGLHVEVREVK
jgi:hypothetical protein